MFKDVKVIELAGVLAGPAAGTFFAELGADVIKIENPKTGGDMTRQWKLATEDPANQSSAYFASANWGKQYLFLDLTAENDLSQLNELIKSADIIISNWKEGDGEKFKLSYADLKKIKPDIIYAQLTGFEDERVAYDVVLQAETGWMFMNGDANSGPLKIPVAIIDLFAAHQLKEGILTAYIHKLKTGEGSEVTVSLFDAAVASLANQASNFLMTGVIPERSGSLHPNIAPYGEILKFADGKNIVLAIGTDKQFAGLCKILKCEDLIGDEKYATNKNRVINRVELFEILKERANNLSGEEFIILCNKNNIPIGLIRNMKELFEIDTAQKLILEDEVGKRVKTAVFQIKHGS